MHKAGNIYFIKGTYNMLCQLQIGGIDHAMLVSLDGFGNRWVDPVRVSDFLHITDDEMYEITGHNEYEVHKGAFILNDNK